MPSRTSIFCLLFILAGLGSMQAGGDDDALTFVREFLTEYPAFEADGTMTSTLAENRPPYRCRIEIAFANEKSMSFQYNTNAAKNIIPYDYEYSGRKLVETVYNRERTEPLSRRDADLATRTLFNFVWDVLKEAGQNNPGFKSLVFNGLMSVSRNTLPGRTQITLERRLPVIPVKRVIFTFDEDRRLRSIQIILADGAHHRIDLRRFRAPDSDRRQ